jgi:aryl-alcohol dehydrogenase-like predicted oxidoreductase
VERELLPFCIEQEIGFLAYSPLASGLLSGVYTENTVFADNDWRSRSDTHTGEGLRGSIAKVDRLRQIAERLEVSVPELAIAFTLSNPAVTSAIIGVRKPEHIQSILGAVDLTIDLELLEEIKAIFE